jgi:uncharacterized membrane protein
MLPVIRHFRSHPILVSALLIGLAASLLLPGEHGVVTRSLLGWNVAVYLYLAMTVIMMVRADRSKLRRLAEAQAEGAATVLVIVVVTALVSLAGVVLELSAAKSASAHHALGHVLIALATVAGSWLIVPMLFVLTYASEYYRTPDSPSLQFANAAQDFSPHYIDFLYFTFTIAVACQTADVGVATPRMRRLVLMQSVFSFVFNTAILAFAINMAAGLS